MSAESGAGDAEAPFPAVAADGHPGADLASPRLPPISAIAVGALVLVLIGGIYLVVPLPGAAPMAPAVGLLAGAWALLAGDVAWLSRVRPFAWRPFFQVAAWTFLAYCVIGGLLEAVIVLDGARGSMLIVATLSLLVYAVAVPLNIAFTVARYQDPARGSG